MAAGARPHPSPLAGLTILDMATFVAGPLCGLTLTQLGARVIRVDPPRGGPDVSRWPLAPTGQSLYWTCLNRGKTVESLDLRSPEGRTASAGLLAEGGRDGGIVLTNAVGQPTTDFESLRELREDLIHVQIQGQRDGTSAVDYTVNAASGIASLTGPPNHEGPVNHVLPAWDVACGLYAATALLAADRARRLDGCAQRVEIALEDVAVAVMGNLGFYAESFLNRAERAKHGNEVFGLLARDFELVDGGRVMVVIVTDRHWRSLLAETGLGHAMESVAHAIDADFSTTHGRFEHREAILGLLASWFRSQPRRQAEAALAASTLPWSHFLTTRQASEASVAEDGVLRMIDQPGVGTFPAAASPIRWDGSWLGRELIAPSLDTDRTLTG